MRERRKRRYELEQLHDEQKPLIRTASAEAPPRAQHGWTFMSTHVQNLRERYLTLVEAMVAGTIWEDDPLPVFGRRKYDTRVREQGLDWPSMAFTMIGVKRLRNFRYLIESVIRENVPGDIIETGVWRGGACILARAVLEAYNVKDRRVILAELVRGVAATERAGLPPRCRLHLPHVRGPRRPDWGIIYLTERRDCHRIAFVAEGKSR